jgi:selenide,water dikinase
LGPEGLSQVLRPLKNMFPEADFPDVLRGLSAPDDAAVLKLDDTNALVLTADFFAPIVDDPYEFGAIAAANALSDIYAMGARPILAINLVGFPETLDGAILTEIMRGGADKVLEAGAIVAGGHTTKDDEPKYGLAVVGLVAVDDMLANEGAKPGDRLVLTKPLGTGIVATALKRDQAGEAAVRAATESMMRLSAAPVAAIRKVPSGAVHALTDITGFSLAGHGHEMADLSGVALKIDTDALPFLPDAVSLAAQGVSSGGLARNRDYFEQWTQLAGNGGPEESLLFDPQTSGGLLMSVDPAHLDALMAAMAAEGQDAWLIGEVLDGPKGHVITG